MPTALIISTRSALVSKRKLSPSTSFSSRDIIIYQPHQPAIELNYSQLNYIASQLSYYISYYRQIAKLLQLELQVKIKLEELNLSSDEICEVLSPFSEANIIDPFRDLNNQHKQESFFQEHFIYVVITLVTSSYIVQQTPSKSSHPWDLSKCPDQRGGLISGVDLHALGRILSDIFEVQVSGVFRLEGLHCTFFLLS